MSSLSSGRTPDRDPDAAPNRAPKRALGRRPPHPHVAPPRLAVHLRTALPAAPPGVLAPVPAGGWILGGNDHVGDCTVVACANAILGWTAANGAPFRVPDGVILQRYAALSGYRPGDPATDTGAVETDVLGMWTRQGWAVGRQVPDVMLWAAIDPRDLAVVRQTIHLFGGTYIGLDLPLSAQSQTVWDVVPGAAGQAGSWGGHAVWVAGYDADGLTCITWGQPLRMSWAFWSAYAEEAYALLDRDDWLNTAGRACGVDFTTLAAALAAL